MAPEQAERSRLILIRFSSMGDVILACAAAAAAIRSGRYTAVALVTKSEYARMARMVTGLHVIELAPAAGLVDLVRLAGTVRAWRPSRLVDLHGSIRSRLMRVLMFWIPSVQYDRQLDVRRRIIGGSSVDQMQHVVDRFCDAIGVPAINGAWLQVADPDKTRMVGLVPGAAWATKRWPVDRWRELAAQIRSRGYSVAWIGGAGEAADIQLLAEPEDDQWVGRPLAGLARQMSLLNSVVAGDTGLAHLAAGLGIPVHVIYGPTNERLGYVPWGEHTATSARLECQPCSPFGSDECPLGHHDCMKSVTVVQVLGDLRIGTAVDR